jgi:two-component system, chemotaxis family, protein-glutamate methylesterase/glutaminase
VGASAGGVEALQVLAAGLPPDLPAALFVVLHIGEGINGRSELPGILTNAGPLPAKNPVEGEPIRHGTIYVAPPDRHLLIADGHIHLSRGPKENRTRPAINPLFRSAARAYTERVTGVILSGLLDDGVAGLAEIKRRAGIAIAQDPASAKFPSMPVNAIRQVPIDHILSVEAIPAMVAQLASTEHPAMPKEEPIERVRIEMTCPECRGPLWEERQGRIVEYQCRVGHAYSPLTLSAEHQATVERTLWEAVLALEEAAEIAERHLAPELGAQAATEANNKRQNAAAIRRMLDRPGGE